METAAPWIDIQLKHRRHAIEAVLQTGEVIRSVQRSGKLDITIKPDGSPVTRADKMGEDTLKRHLAREFPDYGFYGEESEPTQGPSPYRWSADTIDGTHSFINGEKTCVTSLALLRGDKPVLGIIHNFNTGETYCTGENLESFVQYLNFRHPLPHIKPTDLEHSVVNVCINRRNAESYGTFIELWMAGHIGKIVSTPGSIAYNLAQVAEGSNGAFVAVTTRSLSEWDYATGAYLIEKAGGTFEISEDRRVTLAATTPNIFDQLKAHLERPQRD